MNKNDNDEKENVERNKNEMSGSEIDGNLEASFPASDAPSWTLGSYHRAEAESSAKSEKRLIKKL
jgi:hypothetical protein